MLCVDQQVTNTKESLMSQNNLAYTSVKQETKIEQKTKVRGPNLTPPHTVRLPTGAGLLSWCRSLDDQMKHRKKMIDEARKCAEHHNYTPNMKISKRFKQFFDEEVIEARLRSKRKKKRTKNAEKNNKN